MGGPMDFIVTLSPFRLRTVDFRLKLDNMIEDTQN